jgi:hypothetical protein
MNRSAMVSVLAFVSAAALSLGVAGCSSPTPTGGNEPGNGNPAGSTSSGAGSSSGTSGSSSGPSSSGGTGSSSSGGTAGASSSSGGPAGDDASAGSSSGTTSSGGGDGGLVMPSHGCGQGTSCTPGSDLAAPAAADGFQFVLESGKVTVQPNTEAYYCYYKTIPGNAAIQVGAFQSWMSTGASHHFITYEATSAGNADGALTTPCPGVAGKWVYATSVSGQIIELKMPDNVGLSMNAGTQLVLNLHFVNPNSTPISPVVKLNVLYAKNVQYQAATMVSFNAGINVPPASAAGPGTQTVQGTCTAPAGSKFFAITSHTHKHATLAKVNYLSGGQVQNVVNTTDWESPDVGLFYAPSFLTVKPGDSFTYSCSYSNTSSQAVLVGETAASNEMCMAIGYYFPAGTASCN